MEIARGHSITERMKGAALLQNDVFEDVEADTTATSQAAIVVGLAALAAAIGGARGGLSGIVGGLVFAYLAWLAWSAVTYLIGDKLLGGTATWGELLRTLGFAQSPAILYVFAVIPFIGGLVGFVVAIWVLIAGIVAIRQALDFSTGKAILTAVLGWLTGFVILRALGLALGGIF